MLLLQNHRPLCAVALIENGLHMMGGEGRVSVGWGDPGVAFTQATSPAPQLPPGPGQLCTQNLVCQSCVGGWGGNTGVRAGYVSQGQARGKSRGGLWGKSGASQKA